MSKTILIAIDRAEAQLKEAIDEFKNILNTNVSCFLLVNEEFRKSPAYYGNECPDYFEEIIIDFKNEKLLKTKLEELGLNSNQVVLHCRMEEAIKDLEVIISLLPEGYNQSIESLEITTRKFRMRQAMMANYPEITPKFLQITNPKDLKKEHLEGFTFPVIVKPNGLHSSFLVTKCTNFEELVKTINESFPRAIEVYKREYGTGTPSFVIEEFIKGSMYSIDACVNGEGEVYPLPPVRVVTSADVGKDGYYGYEFTLPSDLSENEIKLANDCVKKCIISVGLINSCAHVELYKTVNGWKIVEIAPRIGGYRQNMYLQAFGINHFLNDLLIHAGREPVITPKFYRFSGCVNIYADKEGVVKHITGVEKASSLDSVIQFGIYIKPGDSAISANNGGKMVADATFGNDDLEKLNADITMFRQLLQFFL